MTFEFHVLKYVSAGIYSQSDVECLDIWFLFSDVWSGCDDVIPYLPGSKLSGDTRSWMYRPAKWNFHLYKG